MTKQTTPLWRRTLLALLALALPLAGFAQTLTQVDFTALVVPQYLSSGTSTRLPVMYRATVSNLMPSTLYRYYTQVGISTDLAGTTTGAGNPLLITPGATTAAATYTYTSSASLTVAGGYATFTSSAAGTYTGWFGVVNTGNARFTAGNTVYMTIALAPDATPAVVEKRLALNQTLTVLALGTGTTATDATVLKGSSLATPKNLVAVYDNVAGTGRPLGLTVVEATGVTIASVPASYSANAGDWNTLIPNVLASGVRRVEQRSVVDGTVVGCASDADGVWPSGANTVSPTAGIAAVALTATDAPLNTSTCGAATAPSVTATPVSLNAFTTVVGTPSASQTVAVSGTNLTAGITVSAPAGYQVSLAAASGYAATVTVPQTNGTATSTPVYVRLTGTTVGTFAGNVTLTSTTATQDVAVTGTVTTATAPTISSFTPITGPVGTTVTVTGTNFTGATSVTLNGVAATNLTVISATSLSFVVPATATTSLIVVNTPNGMATSGTVFTVTSAGPTITSFTPVTGAAGTTVTITGAGFTGATAVTVGGVAITPFTVVNATTITFVLPATATSGPITVTTPAGTDTSTGNFTVTPAVAVPVISALAPGVQVAGGAAVTLSITGTGFTPTSTVNFNGVSYAQTTSTATTIEALIPAAAFITAGSYPVTVTNTAGTSNAFTFTVNNPTTPGAFEDFETGTKGGYASGTAVLVSGTWTFSDALIGTAFNDRSNGLKSARIRVGFIRMDFDKANGAGTVTVNAATFGNDTGATFILEASTDGGTTFTAVAGAPATLTNVLTPYTITVNIAGNVRFRITSTATVTTSRINIDDISITNFIGSATLASQALPGLSVFPNPATDRLTVSLPTSAPATVALRDLAGRLVLAPAALSADKQLVLPAALASGVYLLEVRQNGVLAVRRIEKN